MGIASDPSRVDGHTCARIPFRLRIGVTGHRTLPDHAGFNELVREQVARAMNLVEPDATMSMEFSVYSQLAEGADRLVVRAVNDEAGARGCHARTAVILPMPPDQYVAIQRFSEASKEEFTRLLHEDTTVRVRTFPELATPDDRDERAHAYEGASRELVDRCDVLIAIWDGGPSRGRGGTAETLLWAAAGAVPCIWVPTVQRQEVLDNLDGDAEHFFNEVHIRAETKRLGTRPAPAYRPRKEQSLASLAAQRGGLSRFDAVRLPKRYATAFEARLRRAKKGGEDLEWIASSSAFASEVSRRFGNRFRWATRAVTILAVGAAAMLALHIAYTSNPVYPSAEAGLIALSAGMVLYLHKTHTHHRWISYRVLAERLRAARFLAPAGIDFRRGAILQAVFLEPESALWVTRAFDEVWNRKWHEQGTRDDGALEADRRIIATWIAGQIDYHRASSTQARGSRGGPRHRNARLFERFRWAIRVLFGATVICAVLDGAGIARTPMTSLSVLLPASAASAGALLSVRQYHMLSKRSITMVTRLSQAQGRVQTASTRQALDDAALRAAQVMVEENEDWLGTLWGLDVEHPM